MMPHSVGRAAHYLKHIAPSVSRIVAALLGGYTLAALSSVATLALPVSKYQAVLSGMLISFIVYTAAVIWVYLAQTAWRAWVGLFVFALPLLLATYFIKY